MQNKQFNYLVYGLTIVVLLVVIILNKRVLPVPETFPDFVYQLPLLNAIINGTCSLLLIVSFIQIKKKKIEVHRKLNLVTFCLSALFLISYITYHYLVPETHYGGEGSIKYIYYFILISHIILAASVFPLILISFHRGLNMQVDLHKRIVRFAFPLWLYVTITGVIVYLMISPYYPWNQ